MINPNTGLWEPVNDTPLKSNSFKVDNLKPGIPYSFRVKAKNPAGWGEPSTSDCEVTLKPEFSEYLFKIKKMNIFKLLFIFYFTFSDKPDAPGAPKAKKVG